MVQLATNTLPSKAESLWTIDFQSVRPAGSKAAEGVQRRTSPLGAQGTALCSGLIRHSTFGIRHFTYAPRA